MNTPINATLPGQPHIAFLGEQLHVEGVRLSELAREHGTPLFVYSRAAMLAALAGYQRALVETSHLICYALKANSNLAVLQTFAQAGCGFDVVSAGELARVRANWRIASLAGITGTLGSIGWFTAFALTSAANVRTLGMVEVVFSYNALGQYLVDHVAKRDLPVVQAVGIIFAAVYIGLNILADVIGIVANPRLRHPK